MTSTFRLLVAAMPEIAAVCARIDDPQLRDRAFDVLVAEARMGGDQSYDPGSTATWNSGSLPAAYGVGDTRVDGARG